MAYYLQTEPLTHESFAPFGNVIEYRGEHLNNNQGRCKKFFALGSVQTLGASAVNAHLFHQENAIKPPYKLEVLERHPMGGQLFMPLNKESYLIVVAPGINKPDISQIRCFIADQGQGVIYNTGVWHHPLLALVDNAQFIVMDPADAGPNLDEVYFSDQQSFFVR